MKNTLLLLFSLFALTVSAQLPTLTGATKVRVIKDNDTWLTTITDIATFISAGAGTVTSIDVSGGTTGLTTTGGPVTTSGTITITGTLDADNGGTGFASYAVGDILYASTTSALSKLADVATGNALISGGIGTAPAWGKIGMSTHVSGTLGVANGGTGLTAVGGNGTVIGSNGSANVYFNPTITTTAAAIAYAVSGSNLELNLPNADGANRGTVSTTTQTFAGGKTFSAQITGSAGLTATASASTPSVYANGTAGGNWTAITGTTTLDETYNLVEVGTLSAGITINLPACNATRNGWEYHFQKTGADTFAATVDPNGSETFTDAASTKALYSQSNEFGCKCRWNGSTGTWFALTK